MASNISAQQAAEIARLLGLPALSPMASLQLGYPYFSSQLALWQPYATLLNRLAQAAPYDEVMYMGAESPLFGSFFSPASVALTLMSGSTPNPGAVLQFNLGGVVLSYTVQQGDTIATILAALQSQITENAQVNTSFMANVEGSTLTAFFIGGLGTEGNGNQCIFTSNDATVVGQIGSASLGQVSFGATSGGSNPPGPYFLSPEANEPLYGYVPILRVLESDFINSRENLDIQVAAEFTPRPDELLARAALFERYGRELADRISVPFRPDMVGNNQQVVQRIV